MDNREFKALVHGMRAAKVKKMREKMKPWGHQSNPTLGLLCRRKPVWRPGVRAVVLVAVMWLIVWLLVMLCNCNPVSRQSEEPKTVSITADTGVKYAPWLWVRQGDQDFPTPYRLTDRRTGDLLTVSILVDSQYITMTYSYRDSNGKVSCMDSVCVVTDTVFVLQP